MSKTKIGSVIEINNEKFKVVEKCKSTLVLDEQGNKVMDLKECDLVPYKCENVKTKEILIVPFYEKKRGKRK